MNNMQNVNCCEGCFYTGVIDGYMPECCNCSKVAEYMEANVMEDIRNPLSPKIRQNDDNWQAYKKALRMNRRIYAKKTAKKAPKTLAKVNAKYNRIPPKNSSSLDVMEKKLFHAEKSATYIYRTGVNFEFPSILKNSKIGNSISNLLININAWKCKAEYLINNKDADISGHELKIAIEMQMACENAINFLKKVDTSYDAQIVGLHREDNEDKTVLYLTIGFREKISLSDFLQKTA